MAATRTCSAVTPPPACIPVMLLASRAAAQGGAAPGAGLDWAAVTLAFLAGAVLVHLLAWRSVRLNAQRRAEAEQQVRQLKHDQQHHRELLESSNDLLWEIDEHGIIRYQSPRTLQFYGFPPSEYVGRHSSEFIAAISPPPDRERLLQSAEVLQRERKPYAGLRLPAQHRGGQRRIVESSAAPVFDATGAFRGFRGVDRDVTEQLAAESALRESELRYRTLVENAWEAIVLLDCDTGKFIDANRSACEMFAMPRSDLLTKGPVDLTPADDPDLPDPAHAAAQRIEAALRSGRVDFEWVHQDAHGRRFPVELHLVHVPDARRRLVRGSILDISARRAAERLQQLQRERLAQAEKVLALGTLVGGLAHEINNPTHAILLNMPLLRQAWVDAEPILAARARDEPGLRVANLPFAELQREIPALLAEIELGANRIKNLIGQLRSYARESGTGSTGPVDLNRIVETATSMLGATLRQATGHLHVELTEQLPPVLGTRRRLEQAVLNLLLNACQSLTDVSQAIHLTTHWDREHGEAIVEVRDEGCGIAAADLPHVTDPFFTSRRDLGALGLGLSIVARIAEDHHGRFEIQSDAGAGTTARLRLPVATART